MFGIISITPYTVNTVPTTCPDLIVPPNGMISYNMGTASLKPVNTVATFTCNTGYTLNGGTTRACVSGGVWSGSGPVCQRKCLNLYSLFVDSLFQLLVLIYHH